MQKSTNRFCNGKAMLLCFLVAVSPVALFAQSYQSLAEKVSVNLENTTADVVVKSLEKQTSYTFTYDPEYLQHCTLATVKFNNQPLAEVLRYLDVYAPLDIAFANKTIALKQGRQERAVGQDKGRVTGKVVDNKNEPLPGVTVQASNGVGSVTNVDGSYELSLEPGSYTLTFSYVSYDTRKVTEVVINEKAALPLNIILKSNSSRLKEVTVTGNYKKASVEGLYALQKNNSAISDGISAEQIARTPDKNIGEVLKRVSGLSTMDNKYVVVRGLSERYNQAVLNGQTMPSTELNRKNFSFDIIPSNIVDNVTVVKTLTPDRSAEFGGGLVEVNTLDIPTSNFLNVSVGGSYNDKTTGKDFLTLKRENREYFGKVASHRELMGSLDWTNTKDIVTKYNAGGTTDFLSNNWGLYNLKAAPSQNYQLSGGRVMAVKGGGEFGVIASLGYRNTLATQDVLMSRDGFYGHDTTDISGYARYKGKRYGFTTNVGGLLGVGFRNSRNRIGFQSMYLRTLDEQLIIGAGANAETGSEAYQLGYYDLTAQTTLWQNLLKGEHSIGQHGIKFKWVGGYLQLDRQKPDNHQLLIPFIKTDGSSINEYSIQAAHSSGIDAGALRWWSRAKEKNYTWDASLAVPVVINAGKLTLNNTFKAGYAGWSKDRLFYVLNVGTGFNNHGGYYQPLAEAFTAQNNVSSAINKFGDDFHRTAQLHAVYGMLDTKIGNRLRLVGGVRAEYYNLNNTNAVLDSLFIQINQSRGNDEKYDYSELKNREPNWHVFPSVNLTYSLTPQMNLRLAYAKSIIRPDLRDLSNFREYDFELGGIYQSQLVRSTLAKHYDFRYEWYPGAGEVMSFSLFYKQFDYPMEIYADEGSGNVFELKNNKKAKNYGLEIEMRKSLAFTKVPVLKNLTLYGNFTTLNSYVTPLEVKYNSLDPTNPLKITPVEVLGKEEKRPQTGASNYIVNAGAYYDVKPASVSLVYNYVSNRMFRPDVAYQNSLFERPLESLDAQLAIRFFKQHGEIKFNVSNLLNSASLVYKNRFDNDPDILNHTKTPTTKQLLYKDGEDAIDYQAKPGRTYSTTISYKF